MKKILFVFLICFKASTIYASEVWSGYATVPAGMGWPDYTMHIKLILDDSAGDSGRYEGRVELTGQMKCRSEVDLLFLTINNRNIEVRSKPLPTPGCGYFYFKGSVVDGEWIGKMPWNGRQNELIFKKH
ncbi:hypothetical protein ICN19_02300 [Polynucleobacter sp. AP-Capit-er-40B-B4]|uniref:hypothetical protein n=1 Tax=Polynucleobacter sp. AP-Capit-er-40B-B4 TaxID=2576927 RepID=UPI001C0E04D2|nr:hypothetical protein [Polynucleobacter sp. AP-Capit-er-40B-B4]MBU3580844.1 hypothetical protein [Polynucleobacter sp. AP-Capit-er-40B-B4]